MSQEDLAKLLQFATATARVPAGGFRVLDPPLTLVALPESDLLPVAHTCMNRIDLPRYGDPAVLREKLRQAITLGSYGFGLV